VGGREEYTNDEKFHTSLSYVGLGSDRGLVEKKEGKKYHLKEAKSRKGGKGDKLLFRITV